MIRTVKALDWHRNGVGGQGFYVALIRDEDGTEKVAIRFPGPRGGDIRCAVLDVAKLADTSKADIERIGFTMNSWRGDVFDETMAPAIEARLRAESSQFADEDVAGFFA